MLKIAKLLAKDFLLLFAHLTIIVLFDVVFSAFVTLNLWIWYFVIDYCIKMPCHWNTALVFEVCFIFVAIYSIVSIWIKDHARRPAP